MGFPDDPGGGRAAGRQALRTTGAMTPARPARRAASLLLLCLLCGPVVAQPGCSALTEPNEFVEGDGAGPGPGEGEGERPDGGGRPGEGEGEGEGPGEGVGPPPDPCDACAPEQVCHAGSCPASCPGGLDDCAGRCADTQTAPDHCGGCGRACLPARGAGVCVRGACVVGRCDPGFHDADADAATGCEYECVPTAAQEQASDGADEDCDGATDEDWDLAADTQNCGECGHACAFEHAQAL